VEPNSQAWIDALRHSHDALRSIVEPLDEAALRRQSYASDWSIAQVLSHLGSGAEIFGLFVESGLAGAQPPGRDTFPPIWQTWNERSPQAQATDALATDETLVKRFEALDADQRDGIRMHMFGMDLDLTGLLRMRLGEHAVHTWDIAVALEPAATVAADAVSLLVDALGPTAARSGKPTDRPLAVRVSTTDPVREFLIDSRDTVRLESVDADSSLPHLRLPAEALVRLVYGRLDPAHTPPVGARDVDLDELRRMFPGF
jgi:uncharacterized protein (TIGR03083 family)